jgi:NTE family protein
LGVETKRISLALQGGGSHGAFTWGVLDRLLEDDRLDIEGISGASSGAMNAVVIAYGYAVEGRAGARQALREFWEAVSSKAPFLHLEEIQAVGDAANPPTLTKALAWLTRFFAPHQLNPLDVNPLRAIVADQIDFGRLRATGRIKLFVAATEVRTGRLRLFQNDDLTLEALLASACLPTLHRPIEIDGEAYWDGALSANPPLYPLVRHCTARDVIMVLLHPSRRKQLPATAEEIWQRVSEMSFTSAFVTELDDLVRAKQDAEGERLAFSRMERKLLALNLHVVATDELMAQLSPASRLNVQPAFIDSLFKEGRDRADSWLRATFPLIGRRSSVALERLLPPPPTAEPAR